MHMHNHVGHAIDSGNGLSITIDKFRVFVNKTLSILSAYQYELINRGAYQQLVDSR
jgi:hypothetical protein